MYLASNNMLPSATIVLMIPEIYFTPKDIKKMHFFAFLYQIIYYTQYMYILSASKKITPLGLRGSLPVITFSPLEAM
jgi:hypothetical protein